jgi:glycosyltransferase involved in cell wall biosynthesis
MMILISFVIPFFNRFELLKKAVCSIISSDFKNFEIILVDDASDAEGLCDILEFIKDFNNITYIKQEKNMGPGAARGRGLDAVKGKWIFFMDSDDTVYSETLPALALFLEEKEDSDIVFLGATVFEWPDGRKEVRQYGDGSLKGCIEYFVNGTSFNIPSWNFVFKTSFVIDNGINFPETYLEEDTYFSITAYCYAKNISYFSGCFYKYNINSVLSIGQQISDYVSDRKSDITFFDQLVFLSNADIDKNKKIVLEKFIYKYILLSLWDRRRYRNSKTVTNALTKLYDTISDFSFNWTKQIYISPCFSRAVSAAMLIKEWGGRVMGFIDNNPSGKRAVSCKNASNLNVHRINEIGNDIIRGGGG